MFKVSCESCGGAIPWPQVARFENAKINGHHAVMRCGCGVELTEKRILKCVMADLREQLTAARVKKEKEE